MLSATHNLKRLLLLVVIAISLCVTACKREPEPVGQSINSPYDSDPNRAYQIRSVTFLGIPFENVKINQQTRTITVSIPAGFSGSDLKPVVTLTENTTLLAGLGGDQPFRAELFCYCNAGGTASIGPNGSTLPQNPIQYSIVARSTAPLTLKSIATPLEVPLNEVTTITVPVNNPYGNLPIVRAYVQRTDGSPPVLLVGNETNENGCALFPCSTEEPGALSFSFSPISRQAVSPGTYTLTLEQAGGQRLTLSQPIRFVKGQPRLDASPAFGYQISLSGNSFQIRGNNLFSDEVTGKLTAQNGQTWTLNPVTSSPNGTTLSMGVPAGLAPGYYAVQLLRNGTDLSGCLRFSVRRSADYPAILSMSGRITCLAQEPVTLQRSVRQAFIISYSAGSEIRLKLTGTTDPARSYAVPVMIPIEASPQFILPDTVLPGSYRATVLTTIQGQVLESEPFEQPIIVQ